LALAIFLRQFNVSSKGEHSKQDVPTDMVLVVNVSPLTMKPSVLPKQKIVFNLYLQQLQE